MRRKIRQISLTSVFILVIFSAKTQDSLQDSLSFSSLNKSKLSFLLDDTYFLAGINSSGVYYSNHFRQLAHKQGFMVGIEQYFPLKGKVFLSSGINLTQRNFSHLKDTPVIVENLFLDLPVSAAFELPIFRNIDFRFTLGLIASLRLHSNVAEYAENTHQPFTYNTSDFTKGNYGWKFGLSVEYKNILFRYRSYSGFVKLDTKDQGMLSSHKFEMGYFLFRNFKK